MAAAGSAELESKRPVGAGMVSAMAWWDTHYEWRVAGCTREASDATYLRSGGRPTSTWGPNNPEGSVVFNRLVDQANRVLDEECASESPRCPQGNNVYNVAEVEGQLHPSAPFVVGPIYERDGVRWAPFSVNVKAAPCAESEGDQAVRERVLRREPTTEDDPDDGALNGYDRWQCRMVGEMNAYKTRYVPWRVPRAPCDNFGFVLRGGYAPGVMVVAAGVVYNALARKLGDPFSVVVGMLDPRDAYAIFGLARVAREYAKTYRNNRHVLALSRAMVKVHDLQQREVSRSILAKKPSDVASLLVDVIRRAKYFKCAIADYPRVEDREGVDVEHIQGAPIRMRTTSSEGKKAADVALEAVTRDGRFVVGPTHTVLGFGTACRHHSDVGGVGLGSAPFQEPTWTDNNERVITLMPMHGPLYAGFEFQMDAGSPIRNGYFDGVSAMVAAVDDDMGSVYDVWQLVTAMNMRGKYALYYIPLSECPDVDTFGGKRAADKIPDVISAISPHEEIVIADEVMVRAAANVVLWEKYRRGMRSALPNSWHTRCNGVMSVRNPNQTIISRAYKPYEVSHYDNFHNLRHAVSAVNPKPVFKSWDEVTPLAPAFMRSCDKADEPPRKRLRPQCCKPRYDAHWGVSVSYEQ